MQIGTVIQELRKSKGISQSELAEKTKISATSLSQIENGHKRPKEETLTLISKALGVPEPFLHLMSVEEKDVPKERKEIYKLLFPTVKSMMEDIFIGRKK